MVAAEWGGRVVKVRRDRMFVKLHYERNGLGYDGLGTQRAILKSLPCMTIITISCHDVYSIF